MTSTTLVAVAQMTSTDNKAQNLLYITKIIQKAASLGVKFISFPENFLYFSHNAKDALMSAESLDGPSINYLRKLACDNLIYLSLGGFQEICDEQKIYNTHIIINNLGQLTSIYRKIHLFSAKLGDGSNFNENNSVKAGDKLVVAKTSYFNAGLSICYDMRFGELFWGLRKRGAEVILIPAAFTHITGPAHWEILLRARAIESQSYVLAAAQIGQNNAHRRCYGHAMIVDPWGNILAQCSDCQDLAFAEISLDYIYKIREQMPVLDNYKELK